MAARLFLRSHLAGLFRFDEDNTLPMKVIVAPDGRLVASVMVAMIDCFDTILFLPDDNPESLHLSVTLEAFDERGEHGALADRWRAYHGEPPDVRWAFLSIDAGRFNEQFIDGIALTVPNALAADEIRLCKMLNARRDDVRALVKRACGRILEDPVVVGVDQAGFDVRGVFDIFRVAVDEPMEKVDDVMKRLKQSA